MASSRPPCQHPALELPLFPGDEARCHACGARLDVRKCGCLAPPEPEVRRLTPEETAQLMAQAYEAIYGKPPVLAAAVLGPRRRW